MGCWKEHLGNSTGTVGKVKGGRGRSSGGWGPRWVLLTLAVLAALVRPGGTAEYSPEPCEWCGGVPDGRHADTFAHPPCSGYYECRHEQLVRVEPCPLGDCFQQSLGRCIHCSLCNCLGKEGLSPWGFLADRFKLRSSRVLAERRASYYSGTQWPEVNALLAFKARNMDPEGVLASWKVPRVSRDSRFVCSWWGIGCSDTSPTVNNITLANLDTNQQTLRHTRNMWGDPRIGQSIPPEFGRLTALEILDLSYIGAGISGGPFGGLIGSLPSELGLCTRLSVLNLEYNMLEGSVPQSFSRLTKLQQLTLNNNLFSGQLDHVLGGLVSLTYLNLQNSNFSGGLPESMSSLSSLDTLNLQYSTLGGTLPRGMGGLTSLAKLTLTSLPNLGGSLPRTMSLLSNLQRLTITSTPLEGPLPAWISGLASLTKVIIQETNMSGALPRAMPETLTNLELSSSNFSGGFPDSLALSLCRQGRAANLSALTLTRNKLSGPFPLGFAKCRWIQTLNLGDNQLEGPFPPLSFFLGFGKSVQDIQIPRNRLNGTLPRQIFQVLDNLQLFDAQGNNLSGPVPLIRCSPGVNPSDYNFEGSPGYGTKILLGNNALSGSIRDALAFFAECELSASVELNLTNNRLTGSLPDDLLVGNVVRLDVSGNFLSGPIPDPVNCSSLLDLRLSRNRLTGDIPQQLLRSCGNLGTLDLQANQLAGALPFPLHSQENSPIQSLRLAENRLSGKIPPQLALLNSLSALDLSGNFLSGSVPTQLTNITNLQLLDVSSNNLTGTVPPELAALTSLKVLSLSRNQLSGEIPLQIAPPNLKSLTLLDLSQNQLAGPIPYGFANDSALIPELNLSYNNLSGPVPGGRGGQLSASGAALIGNPFLCGGAEYADCPVPAADSNTLSAAQIAGMVVGILVALALMALAWWWFLRRKDEWSRGTMLTFRDMDPPLTAKYILDITEHFSDKFLLGRGGFGSVYKATLHDGTEVAIKRLALNSSQGEDEFRAEVQCLGSLLHRNLVSLVGAYIAFPPSKERLLIYDFLSGGSLDNILVEDMDPDSPYCNWDLRRSIATDIARAMKYLHHDCKPGIIHRDMKPANVLMGSDLVARVADFGLAKDADLTRSHMSGEVLGTIGYLSPEYVTLGRMSFKSDVYAYGVTLLQIITGRKPTDDDIATKGLSRWVGTMAAESIVDANLQLQPGEIKEVLGAIKLGLQCITRVPCDRPSMEEVAHMLENLNVFAKGIKTFKKGTSFKLRPNGELTTVPVGATQKGREEDIDEE